MIKQHEYIEKTMNHIVHCWGLDWFPENEVNKWSDMQANLMFLFNCLPEKSLNKEWSEFREDVFFLSLIAFLRGWQAKYG